MNKIDKAREILNWLFLIGTAASIVLYFTSGEDKTVFFYVCITTLFLKILEFMFRFLF